MALIRAEIRQRLGDSSIYDGIVEYQEDFEQERMLASVHPGSLMLCLNCQDGSDSEEEIPSDLYVKREDGSWEIVSGTGAGSDVTADAVASAIGDMDSTQVAQVMASLGAEPEKLLVTVTKSGGTYSADKTWDEITAAYNANKTLVARMSDNYYTLLFSDGADFTFTATVGNTIKRLHLTRSGSDIWTYSEIAVEPEKFIVTFTESGGVISADKTISEIKAAYDAGKTINGIYNTNNYQLRFVGVGIVHFYCVGYTSNSGGYEVYYSVSGLSVLDVDTWSFTSANISKNPTETTVSGTTPTITPAANTIYNCGELTSLTISNPPATGAYSIVFTSGATATTTTIPATILGLENFAPEANTLYEINVLDNRAVVGSWAVSA